MKVRKLMAVAVVIVALGTPVFAHQEITAEDYDAAMKSIRGAVRATGDQIEAQDAAGLAASGTTIIEGFTKARAYWSARQEENALEISGRALAAARRFQEAGAAGNVRAAEVAFGDLRSTCTPCHEQYRERDENDNWRIKQ